MAGGKTLVFLLLVLVCGIIPEVCGANEKPNFLILFADDLGYGDLGFIAANNSRPVAPTPHIDALANNGIIFKEAYAAESVCTPSRSAMLTGRYPSRSGMASSDPDFRTMISAAQKTGFPHAEYTYAEALRDKGYDTALIGKWHLGIGKTGEHLPVEHGFDYFYGMPVTNVQTCGGKSLFKEPHPFIFAIFRFWNIWISMLAIVFFARAFKIIGNLFTLFCLLLILCILCGLYWYIVNITLAAPRSCLLYRNKEIVEQPFKLDNITLRFTHEAIKYINDQASKPEKQPWLLLMSYAKVHTALFTSSLFNGTSGVGEFGDNVQELDWSIGKLMDALEENGFLNNTMVIFTSDNGPFLEEGLEAGSSGYAVTEDGKMHYLTGGKGQSWEGGIRVPTFAYWANKISKKVYSHPVSLMDFYPTMLKLAGHDGVQDRIIDGKDLSKILFSESIENEDGVHTFLYHWCGNILHAVRHGDYKLHYITPIWDSDGEHCDTLVICQCYGRRVQYHEKPLLFNMRLDPGEKSPIDTESEEYGVIFSIINNARLEHEKTFTPVYNQLESFPRPWLMPCCDSSKGDCSCYEETTDFEYLLSEKDSKVNPESSWRQ